jgi:hypothetical protein
MAGQGGGGGVKHTGISPRLCSEPDGGALVDGTFLRSAARFAIKGGIWDDRWIAPQNTAKQNQANKSQLPLSLSGKSSEQEVIAPCSDSGN